MENEFDANYYIYVFNNKIVRIVRTRKPYTPVKVGAKVYNTSYFPEHMSIRDLLYKYSYSLTRDERYFLPEESDVSEDSLTKMKRMTSKIILLEKYENAITILKGTLIKADAHQDVYNRILMREIDHYQNTGEIKNLLKAEFECSKFETVEAYVESVNLKYEDAAEMFAYIRYKNFEVGNLLSEDKFAEVEAITKDILQKLAM
jgi:hypothetical protein